MRLSKQKELLLKAARQHGGKLTIAQALELLYPGPAAGAKEENGRHFSLSRTLSRLEMDKLICRFPGGFTIQEKMQNYDYKLPIDLMPEVCTTATCAEPVLYRDYYGNPLPDRETWERDLKRWYSDFHGELNVPKLECDK